jgi:hypothetical protein
VKREEHSPGGNLVRRVWRVQQTHLTLAELPHCQLAISAIFSGGGVCCATLVARQCHKSLALAIGKRRTHNSDYYREQAAKYRELAEGAKDAATKQEFGTSSCL